MKTKTMLCVQERISLLKKNALGKLTVYLSVSVFFLFLAFLYRLKDIDWQDIYYLDYACFVIVFLVIVLSKKLSYRATIFSYLGLGLIVVATEFIGLGISGMGDSVSLFCVMLSLFYLDRKATGVVVFIIVAIYGFSFYLYVYAGKSLSANDLSYVSWHSSWIGAFAASAAFFVIIGMSLYYFQVQVISLLSKVEHQKRIIEEQNQHIEYLADHDALTGLPTLRVADNRLDEVLEHAAQRNHKSAVLFLDLDGFKGINDTHGHEAGDEVLKIVANRISLVIRSTDTACRIGGDEFLLIVERVEDQNDLEGLCQRLITAISTPLEYNNTELMVESVLVQLAIQIALTTPKAYDTRPMSLCMK